MTSKNGVSIQYNYDNMPKSINGTTFVYDYSGQRVKKNSTVYIGKLYECTSGTCTKYIFAGSNRVAMKTGTSVYYYHTDHLGSSSVMTDSSGIVKEEIYYYPYGKTRSNSGTLNVKQKFTGQELDDETGLYNYGARYYDPEIGRFVSADSIVQDYTDPQTLNRYSYCRNNPIILTDPSGSIFGIDDIIGAVIGALISGIQSDWNFQAMLTGAVIGGVSGGVFSGVEGAAAGAIKGTITNSTIAGAISRAAGGAAAGATAGGMGAAIYGGDIGQGILRGAGLGAVGGAAFGGIGGYFGKTWNMYRVGAYGLAGGGVSELAGNSFSEGAIFAGAAAFARFAYNEFVGFDAEWESGGEAQEKKRLTIPYEHINNCGTQGKSVDINSLVGEGGITSRGINTLPGGNSICGMHDALVVKIDNFFSGQGLGSFMRNTLNIPLMPPAAAFSYGALMADPRAMIFYSIDPTKNR